MCKNNNKIGLFNCNRLGEVTRLIHIAVTLNCNIVCKKLHWDDRKRSRKFVQALGQADNMLADRFVTGEVIRCYQDDRGAACNDLTDIGDRLFKQCGWVARATTRVPSSIKEIVPCFSSPAAYASEWI